ncbi:cysteine hydrolase family protein [Aestuariispira ectoiniformans]|uniref:cysteine hydrolase family protein n=1 Tax=Aestuariispira ectoiniformans TaxID=2775080 RepID=UPI00223A98F9|nr:cysteine hydrolase family protein [Aestuariispira ectoiniformans]
MDKTIDAVVLIDLQKGIVRGVGGDRQAEADANLEAVLGRLKKLLKAARKADLPIIHIQHSGPKGHRVEKGTEGWEFLDAVTPEDGEVVVYKEACDAFYQTSLQEELDLVGAKHIAIAGCMTNYCVDTSCRSAVAHGFNATLCADGHSTVDNGILTFEQIIAHHNKTLDGFDAGDCEVSVRPIAELL